MILDKSVNLFDTLINDYSGFNLMLIHLSLNLISQLRKLLHGSFLMAWIDYEMMTFGVERSIAVSYTHLRAHETLRYLVCRLLLEKI